MTFYCVTATGKIGIEVLSVGSRKELRKQIIRMIKKGFDTFTIETIH